MADIISLVECEAGTSGKVVELVAEDGRILAKLMSLGIVPGVGFTLLRRSPGFVLQAGHTRVALDRTLALAVRVERGG